MTDKRHIAALREQYADLRDRLSELLKALSQATDDHYAHLGDERLTLVVRVAYRKLYTDLGDSHSRLAYLVNKLTPVKPEAVDGARAKSP